MSERKITDLDELLPEDEEVSFTSHSEGIKYSIPLFIPNAVALLIIDNANVIQRMFPAAGELPRIDPESIKLITRIFAIICQRRHPHMNEAWIEDNISLPRLAIILLRLLVPIYEYFKNTGLAEMVKPVKKPMEE
jgi:hypothetical protein